MLSSSFLFFLLPPRNSWSEGSFERRSGGSRAQNTGQWRKGKLNYQSLTCPVLFYSILSRYQYCCLFYFSPFFSVSMYLFDVLHGILPSSPHTSPSLYFSSSSLLCHTSPSSSYLLSPFFISPSSLLSSPL
jgi:hypothetical protein